MSEQQNVELVRGAYAAFAKNDLEHVLNCMAPPVEWVTPQVADLPFTGRRQGRGQVADYFRLNKEMLTMRAFLPSEFVAQGNKVVVLGHGAWTSKATGRDFESDWVHVYTVENGEILAFREFLDVHIAVEACLCTPLGAAAAITDPAPH